MRDDWRGRLTPAEAHFGESLDLNGFELYPQEASPGEEVSLVTSWQVRQPLEEAVLFTHLLGADGIPLAQTDQLDVPGYSWASGDSFLQLHQFRLPTEMDPGEYQIAVGVYSLPESQRLSLTGDAAGADLFPLTTLTVAP